MSNYCVPTNNVYFIKRIRPIEFVVKITWISNDKRYSLVFPKALRFIAVPKDHKFFPVLTQRDQAHDVTYRVS